MDVFGLDLSPEMLEQARTLNPDIRFREGNMLALELEDQVLAGITAFYAIVNLPEESLPLVFREMRRVLQSGGLLLLAFHTGDEVVLVEEMWKQPVTLQFFSSSLPRCAGIWNLRASRLKTSSNGNLTLESGAPKPEGVHLCAQASDKRNNGR